MEKSLEYAQKIMLQVKEIFNEDCENHIPLEELMQDDNLTVFFHSLATMVPALIYTEFTKDDVDNLGFNHIANRLIHQFNTK